MNRNLSMLMAMAMMSTTDTYADGRSIYQRPGTGRLNFTSKPYNVPKPKGLKNWTAFGYWSEAITKKAAAKKILAELEPDRVLPTLNEILKEIHQR